MLRNFISPWWKIYLPIQTSRQKNSLPWPDHPLCFRLSIPAFVPACRSACSTWPLLVLSWFLLVCLHLSFWSNLIQPITCCWTCSLTSSPTLSPKILSPHKIPNYNYLCKLYQHFALMSTPLIWLKKKHNVCIYLKWNLSPPYAP